MFKNDQIDNELFYKVDSNQRLALDMLLEAKSLNNNLSVSDKTKKEFLSITIEFMGSIARAVLESIKEKYRGGEIERKLVTAHLNCGMWWRHPNDEYIQDQSIKLVEERFSSYYLANFKSLLD